MRVLLAAPTSDKKAYCYEDWKNQVRNFSYANTDVLLIDNSLDPNYHHKYLEDGLMAFHCAPKGSPVDFITECQNQIRAYFLNGNYDYLFMLETDVFVPKNIVEYLLSHRAPVINLSYLVTIKGNTGICLHGIYRGKKVHRSNIFPMGAGLDVYDGELKELVSHKVGEEFQLFGVGIGCTLIHRDVIQQIPFRVDKSKGLSAFSDSFFHMDLMKHGIPNLLDTSFICEHRRQDWSGAQFFN